MLEPILYFGGQKPTGTTTAGLHGLLTQLIINSRRVNLMTRMLLTQNISIFDTCSRDNNALCGRNEQCISTQNKQGYRCECLSRGGNGSGCAQPPIRCRECRSRKNLCKQLKPCQNGGVCRQQETISFDDRASYICDCLMNFGGPHCELPLKLRYSAEFRGDGFVEIASELLRDKEILITFRTRQADGLLIVKQELACKLEIFIDQGYLVVL